MACRYPQRRNWFTGRCKTPCKNHQAINPITRKCVSKTYLISLHELGYISDDELDLENDGVGRYYEVDHEKHEKHEKYVEEDTEEKRKSDLRDGLVDDIDCYPRKLNILTGKCKAPCESHKAINPATGQCVTKRYLRTLDFNLYDEDEEDMMAANIMFVPSVDQSIKAAGNNVNLIKLIRGSVLTVADIRTMRGIYLGSKEMNNGPLFGIYSPKKRFGCENNYLKNVLTPASQKCGIISPGKYDSNEVKDMIEMAGDNFTWVTGLSVIEVLKDVSTTLKNLPKDLRLLIVNDTGILRLVVPKLSVIDIAPGFLENNLQILSQENLQKTNENSGMNLSIHRFIPMTSV